MSACQRNAYKMGHSDADPEAYGWLLRARVWIHALIRSNSVW